MALSLSEVVLEVVEQAAPAALVVVAHLLVEELLVLEQQFSPILYCLENDGDERFALRRAVGPGPSEDKLAVRHDFLVDPGAFVSFAVGAAEHDAKAPAHAHVELGERNRLAELDV